MYRQYFSNFGLVLRAETALLVGRTPCPRDVVEQREYPTDRYYLLQVHILRIHHRDHRRASDAAAHFFHTSLPLDQNVSGMTMHVLALNASTILTMGAAPQRRAR